MEPKAPWYFDYKWISNLTAMSTIIVVFLYAAHSFINESAIFRDKVFEHQAHDREMFRDELKILHKNSDRLWHVVSENQRLLVQLKALIEVDVKISEELLIQVRNLFASIKELIKALKKQDPDAELLPFPREERKI
jgi:hypothetical protein